MGAVGPDAELRRWLLDHDATPDQVEAVLRGVDLGGVAARLVLVRGVELSARDIGARLGMDADRVVALFHNYGVAVPDVDAAQFTEADARLVEGSEAAGVLDSTDGRVVMRVLAAALDRVAEAGVALYLQNTEERLELEGTGPLGWLQEAQRMAELATELGLGMGVLFRHHMLQAVGRQGDSQVEVTSRDVAWRAVGFVDLVGSTALAETLEMGELRTLVSEFEARAFDVASAHGGRVVKFIGDEIMVAAVNPLAGCRLMLALLDACSTGGMQPRGGLAWGEVLFRGGDYYGREVNLASRLVDAAIPGEVLVDSSMVEAVSSGGIDDAGVVFERAGRRLLKGFADPTAVWSVSPSLAEG